MSSTAPLVASHVDRRTQVALANRRPKRLVGVKSGSGWNRSRSLRLRAAMTMIDNAQIGAKMSATTSFLPMSQNNPSTKWPSAVWIGSSWVSRAMTSGSRTATPHSHRRGQPPDRGLSPTRSSLRAGCFQCTD